MNQKCIALSARAGITSFFTALVLTSSRIAWFAPVQALARLRRLERGILIDEDKRLRLGPSGQPSLNRRQSGWRSSRES